MSHIITDYYGDSGLDLSVVKMAIVKVNKHAFVRGNANFLFADKVLHLPSLNEIRDLGSRQISRKRLVTAGAVTVIRSTSLAGELMVGSYNWADLQLTAIGLFAAGIFTAPSRLPVDNQLLGADINSPDCG